MILQFDYYCLRIYFAQLNKRSHFKTYQPKHLSDRWLYLLTPSFILHFILQVKPQHNKTQNPPKSSTLFDPVYKLQHSL